MKWTWSVHTLHMQVCLLHGKVRILCHVYGIKYAPWKMYSPSHITHVGHVSRLLHHESNNTQRVSLVLDFKGLSSHKLPVPCP